MRHISQRVEDGRGQASVEAAVLLFTLMLLLALLLQPVCALYTRTVMAHAACESVRILATATENAVPHAFALRRLKAVPQTSVFHAGGTDDWDIRTSLPVQNGTAQVGIVGHVRPLPLLGAVSSAVWEKDDAGVVLGVSQQCCVYPSWLEGNYEEWMRVWE